MLEYVNSIDAWILQLMSNLRNFFVERSYSHSASIGFGIESVHVATYGRLKRYIDLPSLVDWVRSEIKSSIDLELFLPGILNIKAAISQTVQIFAYFSEFILEVSTGLLESFV